VGVLPANRRETLRESYFCRFGNRPRRRVTLFGGWYYTAHSACGWIRKGETRELKSNHGRSNVSTNGALSWPVREFVHRQAGRIITAAMIVLFEDLQARHSTVTAIHVVPDNPRYNHSKELKAWLVAMIAALWWSTCRLMRRTWT
jgi:hypothetical protein